MHDEEYVEVTVGEEYEPISNANLEFRKIPSLDFLYEVNSNGTIFRNVKSKKQLKIKLDYHYSKDGYYATFVNIKGKPKRVMIARVVAECWRGIRPGGWEVDHIDRNSHNNDYRNLRWASRSMQMKNRDHTNISRQGKKNLDSHRKKISVHVTIYGRNEIKNFDSIMDAARYLSYKYDVDLEHIRGKLKHRRSHIYDYEVEYLDGMQRLQPITLRSKEQSGS